METPEDSSVAFYLLPGDEDKVIQQNEEFELIAEFAAITILQIDGVTSVGVVDDKTHFPLPVNPQLLGSKTLVVNCTDALFATYLELFSQHTCRELVKWAKPIPDEHWPWQSVVRDSLARMTLGHPPLFDIPALVKALKETSVANHLTPSTTIGVEEAAVTIHTDMSFQLVPENIELFRGQLEGAHAQYGSAVEPRKAFSDKDIAFIRQTAKQARILNPSTGKFTSAS